MPAAQGHTGRFEPYDELTEPFFSVNWIHHFGNEHDLAFAAEEAEAIRAAAILSAGSVEQLEQDRAVNEGGFFVFMMELIERGTLGRLLEFTEADELERNPKQVVIDL